MTSKWRRTDVDTMLFIISTSIHCRFDVMCPLGFCKNYKSETFHEEDFEEKMFNNYILVKAS